MILKCVKKDLLRRMKSPMGSLIMMSIPVILSGIIGLTFGGGPSQFPVIHVLVEDHDNGIVSGLLKGAFNQGELAELIVLESVTTNGRVQIDKGNASALLIIPENFSRDVINQVPTTLTLVKNPSEQIAPQIVFDVIDTFALVFAEVAGVFSNPLAMIMAAVQNTDVLSDSLMSDLSIDIKHTFEQVSEYIFPPAIKIEEVSIGTGKPRMNIFAYFFPGMLILGMLFVAEICWRDLLIERDQGTMDRLLGNGVPVRSLLLSKGLSGMIFSFVSFAILIVAGRWIFDIHWGGFWAITALLAVLCYACMGLLAGIYGFVRTQQQGGAVSAVVIMLMSLLGGSLFPISGLPEIVQMIGRFTVNYWGVEGFNTLILHGGGLNQLGYPLLILACYGTAGLILGIAGMQYHLNKGNH
jgi:ABC-type multidrug transport system permease subunit